MVAAKGGGERVGRGFEVTGSDAVVVVVVVVMMMMMMIIIIINVFCNKNINTVGTNNDFSQHSIVC